MINDIPTFVISNVAHDPGAPSDFNVTFDFPIEDALLESALDVTYRNLDAAEETDLITDRTAVPAFSIAYKPGNYSYRNGGVVNVPVGAWPFTESTNVEIRVALARAINQEFRGTTGRLDQHAMERELDDTNEQMMRTADEFEQTGVKSTDPFNIAPKGIRAESILVFDETGDPDHANGRELLIGLQEDADRAEAAAAAALASENKAHDWAEEDEDVEVEPGEYSSHHWSIKANKAPANEIEPILIANLYGIEDQATLIVTDVDTIDIADNRLAIDNDGLIYDLPARTIDRATNMPFLAAGDTYVRLGVAPTAFFALDDVNAYDHTEVVGDYTYVYRVGNPAVVGSLDSFSIAETKAIQLLGVIILDGTQQFVSSYPTVWHWAEGTHKEFSFETSNRLSGLQIEIVADRDWEVTAGTAKSKWRDEFPLADLPNDVVFVRTNGTGGYTFTPTADYEPTDDYDDGAGGLTALTGGAGSAEIAIDTVWMTAPGDIFVVKGREAYSVSTYRNLGSFPADNADGLLPIDGLILLGWLPYDNGGTGFKDERVYNATSVTTSGVPATLLSVADEGSVIAAEVTSINFKGATVEATNPAGSAVDVTITGGGGGGIESTTIVDCTTANQVHNLPALSAENDGLLYLVGKIGDYKLIAKPYFLNRLDGSGTSYGVETRDAGQAFVTLKADFANNLWHIVSQQNTWMLEGLKMYLACNKLLTYSSDSTNALAADQASTARRVTVAGGVDVAAIGPFSGVIYSSFAFDGIDEYMRAPASPDWDIGESLSNDWTIDLWVKHTNATSASSETLAVQYEDASNHWWLYRSTSETFIFTLVTGGVTEVLLTSAAHADTDWHRVTIVKLGSNLALYVDGVREATDTQTITDTFAADVHFGQSGLTSNWLAGNLSDIVIANQNIYSADPTSADPLPDRNHAFGGIYNG